MPDKARRVDADIRREIAGEREQFLNALADLRAAIEGKRRVATVAGGAVATGVATAVVLKVARRLTGR